MPSALQNSQLPVHMDYGTRGSARSYINEVHSMNGDTWPSWRGRARRGVTEHWGWFCLSFTNLELNVTYI
ncbi:uncharacterized protein LOC124367755 isoform X3 [Homalodisca vitripennis]|uniref:uncharacterized protein LOC124367755 isoform X3 n=1 Tax=Homalodisca vitripennis TaxID=197043 RepID=UPI001EEBF505|nr:uncharacterized protein LOC124367755 isoform X3 [Homalodisca vitripennis]